MGKRILMVVAIVLVLALIAAGVYQFGVGQQSANATTDAWTSKFNACYSTYGQDKAQLDLCLTAIPPR